MIKIDTLTEQQINNIPIRNINLGVRIKNILLNENINTLEDLKCLADFWILIRNPAKKISLNGHADKEAIHSIVFSLL